MSTKKIINKKIPPKKQKILQIATNFLKNKIQKLKNIIINSFKKSSQGEEDLYVLLWVWSILPVLFWIMIVPRRLTQSQFINVIVSIAIGIYFVWHIFAIKRTIAKHPEYKHKQSKKEKLDYNNLSKKEIQKIKQKQRQKENIDVCKKLMLMKKWKTTEFYKIVSIVDCAVVLTQISKILELTNF